MRFDALSGAGVHIGAAAGREHLRAVPQQARDHPRLAVAEIGLAMLREDIADALPGRRLDFAVGVGEGKLEPGGETLADGGLAGAHQTDQDDAPRPKRLPNGSTPLLAVLLAPGRSFAHPFGVSPLALRAAHGSTNLAC